MQVSNKYYLLTNSINESRITNNLTVPAFTCTIAVSRLFIKDLFIQLLTDLDTTPSCHNSALHPLYLTVLLILDVSLHHLFKKIFNKIF